MYKDAARLQHGRWKRTSIAGVTQLESPEGKSLISGPNIDIAAILTIAKAFLLLAPSETPQVIMATLLDKTPTVHRCLSSSHVPVPDQLGIPRPSHNIKVFIRRFDRRNTVVTTVVSLSRVRALLNAGEDGYVLVTHEDLPQPAGSFLNSF